MSDLTNSEIERKNILNNNIAIPFIYEQVSYVGVLFEGKYRFTKNQVSSYFEVDNRTIDRLLENHKNELEDLAVRHNKRVADPTSDLSSHIANVRQQTAETNRCSTFVM
jgi:hypothetical protein